MSAPDDSRSARYDELTGYHTLAHVVLSRVAVTSLLRTAGARVKFCTGVVATGVFVASKAVRAPPPTSCRVLGQETVKSKTIRWCIELTEL